MTQDEQYAIIGMALSNKKVLELVLSNETEFTSPAAGTVISSIKSLVELGEKINPVTISDDLCKHYGGNKYLLKMLDLAEDFSVEYAVELLEDDSNVVALKKNAKELLQYTAACIVNGKVRKVYKKHNTIHVMLRGGVQVVYPENGSPCVTLLVGYNINRFPISYHLLEQMYNERNGIVDDNAQPNKETTEEAEDTTEMVADETTKEPIEVSPKEMKNQRVRSSFFEKYLKVKK